MDVDDLPKQKNDPLAQLCREDLEVFSVEALEERITALKAEINRAQNMIESKGSTRNAADALFSKK